MNANKRPYVAWLRCAKSICQHYEKSGASIEDEKPGVNFDELVDRLNLLRRQQAMAVNRGWKAAELQINEDRRRQLVQIRENADVELSLVRKTEPFKVNESELFRDLLAINEDFAMVDFDAKANRLSVTTKDISLEDFGFGAFNIVLHLDSLTTSSSRKAYYEVIALDANRPSSNDDVTHPHIQDDRLCEGDAQPTIKLALQQGRLLDFFQIVEQVLGTYNASSAYVTLREWEGSTCNHCGYSADADESRECGGCEAFICDSCIYQCRDCEEAFCGNCEHACGGCLESFCKSCVSTCSDCDERFCSDCLTEDERCTDCETKKKEEADKGAAETTIHSDGVGEACVPA